MRYGKIFDLHRNGIYSIFSLLTQPVLRAIGVSHTQLAQMSFDKIFDLTA